MVLDHALNMIPSLVIRNYMEYAEREGEAYSENLLIHQRLQGLYCLIEHITIPLVRH